MCGQKGFTLTELLVVCSIVAILAAVATPAYINYVNRSKQGHAASMLLTARLEMEEFYTDNGHYASTIQCLPSFAGANTACLTNCSGCANSSTVQHYSFFVSVKPASSTALYYQVAATRLVYAGADPDMLTISANTTSPTVVNTNALKFSVFQWLFQ